MKLPLLPTRSTALMRFMGHRNSLMPRSLAILILLVLVMNLGVAAFNGINTAREIAALDQTHAEVETQITLSTSQLTKTRLIKPISNGNAIKTDKPLTDEQRSNLNAVVRQLNTPWQDLFNQLERYTPKDVALISLEPDARRASIRLQAEAKTLDTLLAYAASLQETGVLGTLTYSKHETNEQDSNKPVRLSVELTVHTPQRLVGSDTPSRSTKGLAALEVTQ